MSEKNIGFIVHMLGLGDHISYNGMIRRLLIDHELDGVYVGAWRHYAPAVKHMFRDDSRIQVVPIDSGSEYHQIRHLVSAIKPAAWYLLGHTVLPGQPFDDLVTKDMKYYQVSWAELKDQYSYGHRNYYEFMEIDWSHRFMSSYYHRDIPEETRVFNKLNATNEDYAFVQDDPRRGFKFDMRKIQELTGDLKIIYNDTSENIFNYGILLQNAKQIHLMESSMRCLVETLPTEETSFYLHHYIRNTERLVYDGKICPVETRKPWQVIL